MFFQSPLHRGRVFNPGRRRRRGLDPLGFQSPLHRGRVFNRPLEDYDDPARVAFQSPLHRGRVFNLIFFSLSGPISAPFSPLFIGEGSSTREWWPASSSSSSTFSPLFIGEGSSTRSRHLVDRALGAAFSPLFIGEGSSTFITGDRDLEFGVKLSVPSSSGKGLQPPPRLEARNEPAPFQSPLHRGRVFNRLRRIFPRASPYPFSPLFIGEGSSTDSPESPSVISNELSVPSSSGKGLQPMLVFQERGDGELLSVPSSSGKGLQPQPKGS